MLVDVQIKEPDEHTKLITRLIAGGDDLALHARIGEGMYLNHHWNFECFVDCEYEMYPEFSDIKKVLRGEEEFLSAFGVCDSPEQWREVYTRVIDDPTRKFFVSFVELLKSEQPPRGGWRWHKWGPYIGKQEPQCEYLFDEPVIERAFTFHVYEVLPEPSRFNQLDIEKEPS